MQEWWTYYGNEMTRENITVIGYIVILPMTIRQWLVENLVDVFLVMSSSRDILLSPNLGHWNWS